MKERYCRIPWIFMKICFGFPGAIAVLGPGPQGRCSQGSDVDTKLLSPVPPHMRISRHKLRAGSGCLSVRLTMDGPIRVLQITDIRDRVIVIFIYLDIFLVSIPIY